MELLKLGACENRMLGPFPGETESAELGGPASAFLTGFWGCCSCSPGDHTHGEAGSRAEVGKW